MVALEVDDEILIKRLLERGKVSGRARFQENNEVINAPCRSRNHP